MLPFCNGKIMHPDFKQTKKEVKSSVGIKISEVEQYTKMSAAPEM